MNWIELLDDKALVILSVLLICIVAMFKVPDASNLVNQAITGLFGVAVGKAIGK